ncbi:MAG: DUF4403 family protein [Planctomycetota bacterium]
MPAKVGADASKGIHVDAIVTTGYTDAEDVLEAALARQPLRLDDGTEISFSNFECYPQDSRIVVGADVAASGISRFPLGVRGRIYLRGTPSYDADAKRFSVPDLEWAIQTKNVLIASAAWLFNDKVRDAFRRAAQFDIASVLERSQTAVQESLKSLQRLKDVRAQVTTGEFELSTPQLTAEGLALIVRLAGDAKIQLR